MLKEFINSINFYDTTSDRNFFHPISDREYWDAFSEKYLDKIVERYEKITAEPRGELTASLYLDYSRTNNRARFQNVYERRRDELLFATLIECCRNDGALLDDILDLTWMILEETTWCFPAHNRSVDTIADSLPYYKKWSITICSTRTAVKLAFVYQVMGEKLDEISKMVTMRIREVIQEKVLSEMLERDDYWYMGFCQHNTIKGTPKEESYRSDNVVYNKEENVSALSMSIKNAYENRDEIKAFDRCVQINKSVGIITVTDDFDLGKEAEITWNFLTHQKPEWDGTKITLATEANKLEIIPTGADFTFTGETVDYDDDSMRAKWGDKLYRVLLSAKVNKGEVKFEIK